MRTLLNDPSLLSLAAAGVLSLLIACGGEEKKPAATAAAPPPTAQAAGAHASGEMGTATVTVTPPPPQPEGAPVVVEEDLKTLCNLPVQPESGLPFDYDVAELSTGDEGTLSALATCLGQERLSGETIEIVGHTDPRGSEQYNMELGMRRATQVRDYLVEKGVPASSVIVKSEGETQASGDNEQGWALDRRVEIGVAASETPSEAPENPY